MSENIRQGIVRPDGSVPPLRDNPDFKWGAPRRKKQPTSDAMREQLVLAAAEKIRLLTLLDGAMPIAVVCKWVVVAAAIGFWLGRFVQ